MTLECGVLREEMRYRRNVLCSQYRDETKLTHLHTCSDDWAHMNRIKRLTGSLQDNGIMYPTPDAGEHGLKKGQRFVTRERFVLAERPRHKHDVGQGWYRE